jgi:hypothetical protein
MNLIKTPYAGINLEFRTKKKEDSNEQKPEQPSHVQK